MPRTQLLKAAIEILELFLDGILILAAEALDDGGGIDGGARGRAGLAAVGVLDVEEGGAGFAPGVEVGGGAFFAEGVDFGGGARGGEEGAQV